MIYKVLYIYTYIIHYAYAYNYTLYVFREEGDHQQLLRAKLKLVKFPTSITVVVIDP